MFYLNYLIVGEKRSKQSKGPHHYQGHASSTRKKSLSHLSSQTIFDHGISAIQPQSSPGGQLFLTQSQPGTSMNPSTTTTTIKQQRILRAAAQLPHLITNKIVSLSRPSDVLPTLPPSSLCHCKWGTPIHPPRLTEIKNTMNTPISYVVCCLCSHKFVSHCGSN